jgi:hypothetical protein
MVRGLTTIWPTIEPSGCLVAFILVWVARLAKRVGVTLALIEKRVDDAFVVERLDQKPSAAVLISFQALMAQMGAPPGTGTFATYLVRRVVSP